MGLERSQRLSMINFGGGVSSILGIALMLSAAALYFMRSFRPELARDYDIFFSAVALVCGGILLFQGWRLDPLLLLGQLALAGSAAFFAFDNIRMRGITTQQAKRSTPIVDDERPVSRVYRAELDELDYVDERPPARRIRGIEDPGDDRYYDEYDSARRRPSSRPAPERRLRGSGDYPAPPPEPVAAPRRSSSRPPRPRYSDRPVEATWDEGYNRPPAPDYNRPSVDGPSGEPPVRSSSTRPPSPDGPTPRRSRRRPPSESASPGDSAYVDYQPLGQYPAPNPESYRNLS
jgi:hypothetical protein